MVAAHNKKGQDVSNTMKLCVIGGSNSLMMRGYVPPTVEMLQNKTGRSVELTNVSIGGTFSHFGIWQLLTKRPHVDADIIVVEYVLNDAELASFGVVQHWAKAYEGLICKLRTDAPRAQIICPLLVNRRMATNPKLSTLVSGVAMINMRYGIETIDVNQEISQRTPSGYWKDREEWYIDGSHYAKPFQVMIGDMLVSRIEAGTGHSHVRDVLPVSLDHFAQARSAVREGVFDQIVPATFERKTFQNRLIDETAALVPGGASLEFQLTGEIVAFIVMSTRHDGVITYHYGEKSVNAGLYRKAFSNPKYEFLMNVLVPDQYFRGQLGAASKPTKVTLDVLDAEAIAALDEKNVLSRPSASVPPQELAEHRSFSLVDIVYTGDIAPL